MNNPTRLLGSEETMYYQTALETWPAASREASERVILAHGPPDEACPTRLIWHNNRPWKRTEVYREPVHHDWPQPHHDLVLNAISYRVPPGACADLARFHGSIIIDATRGELAARCTTEAENVLALNLAHGIVTGQQSVEEARDAYARSRDALQRGRSVNLARRLLFDGRLVSLQAPIETGHALSLSTT